jgi:hypothetical protein
MSKKHRQRYLIYILIGFLLTTSGIFTIIYVIFTNARKADWVFWGLVSTILVNTGLYFLGNGWVHKVKADLSRRQRNKSKAESTLTQSE